MTRRCWPLSLLLLTACPHRVPDAMPTTIVFIAGTVHTLDARQPRAQALVVREGKLAFVGDERGALALAGPEAAVERWPGSTIVPGLVDAHAHLAALGRAMAIVGFDGLSSEAEAVARAQAAGPGARQGDWLLGRGWDQNHWPSAAFPTKASLDAAFPTTPVLFTRVDGHAAWVNSEALRRAGVSRATVDPPGGRLVRDAAGEPTGVLLDNAIDLVSAKVPPASREVQQKRLKAALEWCAALGLTGVHDAGMDLATFKLLQEWDAIDALPLRVYAMADGQGAEAEVFLGMGRFKGRKLELRAVKLLADGALGSRGAALLAPYSDEPGQAGLLLLTRAQLEEKAKAFADAGFQVAVHAIGDWANREVLDVLAALEKAHPGSRHRVEHAQVLSPEDLARFASAHVVASMQPTHATSDAPWAEARLGPQRVQFAYAWKSLLGAGVPLAFGSDFPVEHPDPLAGLFAARTRQSPAGQPPGGFLPAQRLTGLEALAAFTTGAAYAGFAEDVRGTLAVGQDADFVVLPVDPVDGEPRALLGAKVQVTMVGGVDVYRAPPAK